MIGDIFVLGAIFITFGYMILTSYYMDKEEKELMEKRNKEKSKDFWNELKWKTEWRKVLGNWVDKV